MGGLHISPVTPHWLITGKQVHFYPMPENVQALSHCSCDLQYFYTKQGLLKNLHFAILIKDLPFMEKKNVS